MMNSSAKDRTTPITVMIVDDHPIMRDGLRRVLEMQSDLRIVAQAGNGEDSIVLAREKLPNVVLMDINLPKMNGLEATTQIKAEMRDRVMVVLMTAHDDSSQIHYAMRTGASGYCSKEIEVEKLLETIRLVARGGYAVHGKPFTERSLHAWLEEQAGAISYTDWREPYGPLSPREMEILRCVIRGMSNKQIATELGISHQTVKNHMTNILDKLSLEDRTQAAVYALRQGWVRMGPGEKPPENV